MQQLPLVHKSTRRVQWTIGSLLLLMAIVSAFLALARRDVDVAFPLGMFTFAAFTMLACRFRFRLSHLGAMECGVVASGVAAGLIGAFLSAHATYISSPDGGQFLWGDGIKSVIAAAWALGFLGALCGITAAICYCGFLGLWTFSAWILDRN